MLFIVMFLHDMFSATQYNVWYQFEVTETFLQVLLAKNMISLKPEYLNQQSIYQNKIYHIYWLHKDVCIMKFL